MKTIDIDTSSKRAPTRDGTKLNDIPTPKTSQQHHRLSPTRHRDGEASLLFIGTATTLLRWPDANITLMTDPNFLHAGDHIHLGPGVRATRQTNPYVDLHALPPIDIVLLSHYHADHFDQHVEATLRRDIPIITTPHAHDHLAHKIPETESFTAVTALDPWETACLNLMTHTAHTSGNKKRRPYVRVTGMPGSHVPPGLLSIANEVLQAVPPTNGWMLELGYVPAENRGGSGGDFTCGYRIYISGDTLFVDDLKKIPKMYTHAGKDVDLMLIHLGGTTIPGPHLPALMVTMDARQGIQLVQLICPHLTVPIHYESVIQAGATNTLTCCIVIMMCSCPH